MGTGPGKLAQAQSSVRRELEAARQLEVTPGDVTRRVQALTGRLAMRQLSSLNRAHYLALGEREGLPHTFGDDYRALLLRDTPDQVAAAARRYLPLEFATVIVH